MPPIRSRGYDNFPCAATVLGDTPPVLDAIAVDWVMAQVPEARRLVRAQRLTGGLTSEVTGVTVEDADGRSQRLVLRRWTGRPWPDGAVDDGRVLVPREAAVLSALERTDLPAPRLVATDTSGDAAGMPALLMTRLPGRIDLAPSDPRRWTRQLAEQLVHLHDTTPFQGLPAYETRLHVDVEVPAWSARPELWRAAQAVVRDRQPTAAGGFVHHDYQQFNVLFSRGRISGVVDWVWASRGPTDDDVVHAAINLCLLYGAERAIGFQAHYEQLTGRDVPPWWNAAAALDYAGGWSAAELQKQAGRRLRIDAEALPGRVEAWLAWAMDRAG